MLNEDEIKDANPLTKEMFDDAVDTVYRDFGIFGRHSKRCVYMQDERGITRWCCADDCPIQARIDTVGDRGEYSEP